MANSQGSKVIKTVLSALWWLGIVALAVVLITVVGAKMRGEVPEVLGYSVLSIATGSMEDEINAGDYILIKDCKPEDIKRGDIICFYSDDPNIQGFPNTHRVHEDPIVVDGKYEFITKGDANAVPDIYTAKGDRIIGKYVMTLDALGGFVSMLSGGGTFVFMIILQIASVAMIAITIFIRRKGHGGDESDSDSQN